MAVTTFAAIDVGSHETTLRIYEVSKKSGIHELDYVHHTSGLGYETYSTGHISHPTVENLCRILNGFSIKMKEYGVTDYMIVGTSALREADNGIIVLDQIKQHTGFQVKILSNSEQRFLFYKAIALTPNSFHKFIQKGTLLADVGGGSIQLSTFDKNTLLDTQNLPLGALRIQEVLQDMKNRTDNYQNLLYEHIAHDLHAYAKHHLENTRVKNIIAVGNQLQSFVRYLSIHNFGNLIPTDGRGSKKDSVNREEYDVFYRAIISHNPEELSRELNISLDKTSLLLPTAMIYHILFEITGAEQMWLSGITICDGMAADYAERKAKITPAHSFADDILSTSRKIADRYHCSLKHTSIIENIALKIFDAVKRSNNLTRLDRLLLQISVILHNCGAYINLNDIGENTYKIVTSTEIIGISHQQRMMVANIVRYPIYKFPHYGEMTDIFSREEYIKIAKLNAILRLSDAMDRSHKQKFKKTTVVLRNNTLYITGHTIYDITLEQGVFSNYSGYFEEVFGIHPVLKQRKEF